MAEAGTLDSVKKMIMELCESNPRGVSNTVLNGSMTSVDTQARVNAINQLLALGQIEIVRSKNDVLYRKKAPISAQEADALRSMHDPEERVLYKLIADAGNKGVWLRDLRQASNLPQTQVTKLLKVLEKKKIIKAITSVSAAKKKVYMLFELEPDKSLTGGAWFSDQDFESEFVDVLMDQVARFLSRKAQSSKERNGANGPLAVMNGSFVTVAQVHQYIEDLKISKVSLTHKEVASILEALTLDRLAERDVALREDPADFMPDDKEDEKQITELRFRAAIDPLPVPGLVRTPCGMCPVFDKCNHIGSITPQKCHYFRDWLNE